MAVEQIGTGQPDGYRIAGINTDNLTISESAAGGSGISLTSIGTNAIYCAGTYTNGLNLAGTITTGVTIGACTTGFALTGAYTTGISLSGDGTTAISVTDGFSGTTGFSFAGTATDGILISGACTDGLHISGAYTNGINLTGDGTTAVVVSSGFSGTNMVSLGGTGSNAGVLISGACGKAIEITGSATTGIGILTGTYTTGLSIAGTTTTGISLASTCTTSIAAVTPMTLLITTAAVTALTGLNCVVTCGVAHTGNVAGIRSYVTSDNTGDTHANLFGLVARATTQHASDSVTGTMTGLLCQIDLGAVSNSNACNAWGLCVNHIETGTRAKIPVAFIRFTDADYDGSAPTNYLFDLGGTGDEFPTGTGKIYYNNTLWIRVNSADKYLYTSSAEGYLSITDSSTTAISIGTGTFTTGLSIAGTTTTGISIGACTTGIALTGAVTKGIDFASASLAGTDADDAFISIGSWNDAYVVGTHTDHYVPIQVHLHSNTSVAKDIAAMRLRVDTSAANTLNYVAVEEIRSSVSHNCAGIGTFGAGLSIDGNITIQTGEVVCGGFSIAGTGTVTAAGSNLCKVFEATNWNTSATESVTHVGYFSQNGTGSTVRSLATLIAIAGTATAGLVIEKTSGSIGTGISVTGATTTGISITGTGAAATSKALTTSGWTLNNANLTDGYGAVEVDLTLTGTVAGTCAALSSWVNMAASSTAGGNRICAQNNGIYSSATGTPLTNAICIMGMRMQLVIDGGDDPSGIHCFSTNIYDNVLTSIFEVNTKEDFGWLDGVLSSATGDGHVPLFKEANGTVHYVNTYTA